MEAQPAVKSTADAVTDLVLGLLMLPTKVYNARAARNVLGNGGSFTGIHPHLPTDI